MGIMRKRLVRSSEPCSVAPCDEAKEGDSAQPPDESTAPSPSTAGGLGKRSRRSKPASDVTRPLTIVRMRSKPRQLTSVSEPGTPDWSLSAGVATVLFGFAVAFGTYVTLTQRDAVQSRLHHIASHDEPRTAARHVPRAPIEPAPDSEPASHNANVAPTATSIADDTAPHPATPSPAASAPGTIKSHATAATTTAAAPTAPPPSLAATTAPTVPHPASQRAVINATASPAPARQLSKNTDEGAGVGATATHARATPPAPPSASASKERRVAQKTAKPACGPLKSCDEPVARDEHVAREPATVRPSTKTTTTATTVRDAASGVSAVQVSQIAPPPNQPPTPADTSATLSASVNRDLFRRH